MSKKFKAPSFTAPTASQIKLTQPSSFEENNTQEDNSTAPDNLDKLLNNVIKDLSTDDVFNDVIEAYDENEITKGKEKHTSNGKSKTQNSAVKLKITKCKSDKENSSKKMKKVKEKPEGKKKTSTKVDNHPTQEFTSSLLDDIYSVAVHNVDKWLEDHKDCIGDVHLYGELMETTNFNPDEPLIVEQQICGDEPVDHHTTDDFDVLKDEDVDKLTEDKKSIHNKEIETTEEDQENDFSQIVEKNSEEPSDSIRPGSDSPVFDKNQLNASTQDDMFESKDKTSDDSSEESGEDDSDGQNSQKRPRLPKSTVTKPANFQNPKSDHHKATGGSGDNERLEKTKRLTLFRPFPPKKTVRNTKSPNHQKSKVSIKKRMLERLIEMNGTWVQCCNVDCMKWRHLKSVQDPTTLPDKWTCSGNDDKQYSACSKPEQEWHEDDDGDNFVYARFAEGSVIWAKMDGYPWWPGMVEIDPDIEEYFEVPPRGDSYVPDYYHVVFFDDKVSRSWIREHRLKSFTDDSPETVAMTQYRGKFKKDLNKAVKNAEDALRLPILERIKKYGFASRFKGHWGKEELIGDGQKRELPEKKSDVSRILTDAEKFLSQTVEILDTMEEQLLDQTPQSSSTDRGDDAGSDENFSQEVTPKKEKKRKKKQTKKTSSVNESSSDEEDGKKPRKVKKYAGETLADRREKSKLKKKVPKKTNEANKTNDENGNVSTKKKTSKLKTKDVNTRTTIVKPTFSAPKMPKWKNIPVTNNSQSTVTKSPSVPAPKVSESCDKNDSLVEKSNSELTVTKSKQPLSQTTKPSKSKFSAPKLSSVTPNDKDSNKENVKPMKRKIPDCDIRSFFDVKIADSKVKRKLIVDENSQSQNDVADENSQSQNDVADDISEKCNEKDSYLADNSVFTMELETQQSDLRAASNCCTELSQNCSQVESVSNFEITVEEKDSAVRKSFEMICSQNENRTTDDIIDVAGIDDELSQIASQLSVKYAADGNESDPFEIGEE